jgi:hypothetical protein
MSKRFDEVLGPSRMADAQWHVGLYREGNCLSWASFETRGEAERWIDAPDLCSAAQTSPGFSRN